jgi:hypothetical protein
MGRTRQLVAATAAAVVMIVATGCGDDATTSSSTPANAPLDTTGATTIEVGYAGGAITGGGKRSAALGQTVIIKVTSDTADEVHLHGYDKKADAAPGTVATITFKADKPGIFEVELEKKGLKLFELEVK